MNSCLYKSKLEPYLDQALSVKEMEEVADHFNDCPHCLPELQRLTHCDSLFRRNVDALYPLPPDDYWETLPRVVMGRLGLGRERFTLQTFLQQTTKLFHVRIFQVGFAGAVVAMVLFLALRQSEVGRSKILATAAGPGQEESTISGLGHDAPPESSAAPGAEMDESSKHADLERTVAVLAENESQTVPPDRGIPGGKIRFEPPAEIPARGLLTISPTQQGELAPQPNPEFLLTGIDEDDVSSDDVTLRPTIAARGGTVSGSATEIDVPGPSLKFTEEQSDFAETLWIVQESVTLREKKSIWLSYIAREKNSTYRAMGVYNLAVVLAKIAGNTKDPDEAKEAIEFFEKYGSSLRQQMGDKRYEMKLRALQLIYDYN